MHQQILQVVFQTHYFYAAFSKLHYKFLLKHKNVLATG